MKLQIDYIKRVLTPLDFYRYELPTAKLKKHGWNDGGLCPFHNDINIGSFRININGVRHKVTSKPSKQVAAYAQRALGSLF